jgi:hypothetical protein
MIWSTEQCGHCGRVFDYSAKDRWQIVECPDCKAKMYQCNICTDAESNNCNKCVVEAKRRHRNEDILS